MSTTDMVAVSALTHRFKNRTALNEVSFTVEKGAIFGLLGPNGGGKTTLFRILTTMLTPTSGRATVAGADVIAEPNVVRRRIGIVFQHPSLDGRLTVAENLRHQGHLYGLHGAALRERCDALLAKFDLSDRRSDRAETLSGGLKRRVELAKGMLHDPHVLLLDEPSAGLDPGARAALMDHLRQLRDERAVTVLLTTHLLDEADRCDRVGILDAGRLVALDAPENLKATIGGDLLTVSAADPAALADKVRDKFGGQISLVDGQVRIERDHGAEWVAKLMEAFPGEVQSVTVSRPTLGDVFVRLTGHGLWHNEQEKGAAKP